MFYSIPVVTIMLSLLLFLFNIPVHAQDAIVTERIIYAVNEDYALLNSQWRTGAQDIIDYVNQVLALNTNKRYVIQEFKTLDIARWNQLSSDPAYHFDNGYGGTTIFHWVETPNTKIKPDVNYTYLVNVTNYTSINGVAFQQLFIVESFEYSALLGKGKDTFEGIMQLFLHELGHSMGLSVPDWYMYEFEDLTGVSPTLPRFNLRAQHPQDPMSSWASANYRFADFNAAIINKNLRHEKDYLAVQMIASSKVKVLVEDVNGQKIPGATVQVFGGKKGCFYCRAVESNPLVETATTTPIGEAFITAPSVEWAMNENPGSKYIGLIMKVIKGDLRGGASVIGQQMQQHKFSTGNDVFDLTIRLDASPGGESTTPTPTATPQPTPPIDTDGDGLSDVDERQRGTDPTKADTDGDGFSDSEEVKSGHDPLKKPIPKWVPLTSKKFGVIFVHPEDQRITEYEKPSTAALYAWSVPLPGTTVSVTVYKKQAFFAQQKFAFVVKQLRALLVNSKRYRGERTDTGKKRKKNTWYYHVAGTTVAGLPTLDNRYASAAGNGRSMYIVRGNYVFEIFHDRAYLFGEYEKKKKDAAYTDFEKFLRSVKFKDTAIKKKK